MYAMFDNRITKYGYVVWLSIPDLFDITIYIHFNAFNVQIFQHMNNRFLYLKYVLTALSLVLNTGYPIMPFWTLNTTPYFPIKRFKTKFKNR